MQPIISLYVLTESHGTGHEIAHGILRGFSYRTGSRLSNLIPTSIIIIIGLVVLGYFGYQWYQNRKGHK